jgi:hypothetical protein
MKDKYYIIVSLPYEGDMVHEFKSEQKALEEYTLQERQVSDRADANISGIMLIKGCTLKKKGYIQ